MAALLLLVPLLLVQGWCTVAQNATTTTTTTPSATNVSSNSSTAMSNVTSSLQDLSLDDLDMSMLGGCTLNNSAGGCDDDLCECVDGKAVCRPRCSGALVRRGRKLQDPTCDEKPVDDCCAVIQCPDSEPEALEGCFYKNTTLQRGELFQDGCNATCSCGEGGKVNCKARCPKPPSVMEKGCVMIPDPRDKCCMVQSCNNSASATAPGSANLTEGCDFKGKHYALHAEFHDGCDALCVCGTSGVDCLPLRCPEDGLELLDPHCVQWDLHPKDFVPTPPNCCPDEMKCLFNGSCVYEGQTFNNWAEIPQALTGCEQNCHCEFGNVTCSQVCRPLQENPPEEGCTLGKLPGEDCCQYWICPGHGSNDNHPSGFPRVPSQHPDEVVVHTLEAVDSNSVRLVFSVPPVLVGLHGRIELRFTSDKGNNDMSSWQQQILAPPNDLISTPQLEFVLGDLTPDTEYRVKVTVQLRDLHNSPSSPVLTVRTMAAALPAVIPVDPQLSVASVNSTWVEVRWGTFSDHDAQFIDGIQLRYKEVEGKVYSSTPLIHKAVNSYRLDNLRPGARYEVAIYFIPFPGQTTELQATNRIKVETLPLPDPYKFDVTVAVQQVKSTSAEVTWTGVPYPQDKYVNVFRAIYQSDQGKEDLSVYKVAKHDAQSQTTVRDLKPGTRYRLWLEIYLTNGKIKKSNVLDFTTKPGSATETQQGKLEAEGDPASVSQAGNYYSPLVAVSVLAALAILATLILLLILMKKHSQNKAAISSTTTSRKSQSAYDNPSYKVEIQQETMDL